MQSWVRKSHGTGTGFTTQQGFWIPQQPSAEALAQQAAARTAALSAQPAAQHQVAAKGRRPPDPTEKHMPVRPCRFQLPASTWPASHAPAGAAARCCALLRSMRGLPGCAADTTLSQLHLQAVQLLPLPRGMPEVVRVCCNGRSGEMHVRTQRVTHAGVIMSASRFENACGKGDAKKWKCSVHLEAAPGVAGEVGPCVPGTVLRAAAESNSVSWYRHTCFAGSPGAQ